MRGDVLSDLRRVSEQLWGKGKVVEEVSPKIDYPANNRQSLDIDQSTRQAALTLPNGKRISIQFRSGIYDP